MNKFALKFPGGETIAGPDTLKPLVSKDLASLVSGLLNIAFYIAVFLAFYYLVWGAFAYLMAQGDKENLQKARARITWAIIGLIVVFLAFLIIKWGAEIFPPTKGGLPF